MLESGKDMDITGHTMPNFVYVSRGKSPASPHHFKAGALNVLVNKLTENSSILVIFSYLQLCTCWYFHDRKTMYVMGSSF